MRGISRWHVRITFVVYGEFFSLNKHVIFLICNQVYPKKNYVKSIENQYRVT